MTWQHCDDCGATLLVLIPYDGRALCHTCWEDAKESGCGSGDNQYGDEPTTVTVSLEMFDQAVVHKPCISCGGINTSSNSSGPCQLCRDWHMEHYREKIYSRFKKKRMERYQKKHHTMLKGKAAA